MKEPFEFRYQYDSLLLWLVGVVSISFIDLVIYLDYVKTKSIFPLVLVIVLSSLLLWMLWCRISRNTSFLEIDSNSINWGFTGAPYRKKKIYFEEIAKLEFSHMEDMDLYITDKQDVAHRVSDAHFFTAKKELIRKLLLLHEKYDFELVNQKDWRV